MTRKEEIRQASIEYTIGNRPMCIGGGVFSEIVDELNRNKSFEEGAKWADKTMIDKACKWIENYVENAFTAVDGMMIELHGVELSEDFRKSMED